MRRATSMSRVAAVALSAALFATLPTEALAQHDGGAHRSAVEAETASAAATRQTAPDEVGVLLIAHGAGPEWNGRILEVAEGLDREGPVETTFLMGPAAKELPFQAAIARLVEKGAREVVVVPALVSSHSGHYEQIRWLVGATDSLSESMRHHLEMSGIERSAADVRIRLAAALDDAPAMADVLIERASAVVENPSERALFLIGHGPNSAEDHACWMSNLRRVTGRIAQRGPFRDVKVGLVRDDAADHVRAEAVRSIRETIELQAAWTGRDVVVIPILISSGQVNYHKFPQDLDGLPVAYEPEPLFPHPALEEWIDARVEEALAGKPVGHVACAAETAPETGDSVAR